MAKHNDLGKWGEEIAVAKLVRDGYAIRERNWRMHNYEIDIIAARGPRIVFVEVKTRSDDFVNPIDAVTPKKIQHMVRSANVYMQHSNCHLEPQFDIIGVTGTPDGYEIEHIEDAFYPPLKTY